MNSQVQIVDRAIKLAGQPLSLLSAEIHYWRLEPDIWPRMLEAARELGLETVASYVQWHYHEFEQGRFDFEGTTDPKRNLVAYLDLVRKSGLKLLIRPGPYTFAEWDNYGIPDYVTNFHRLHPSFQAAAARYIREVCQILKPYLYTSGGPIVMVQADNMFDLGQHRYDRQLGLLGGEGVFQEFLLDHYQTIESLNQSWGTHYRSFAQAMATMTNPAGDPIIQPRFLDFLEFKHWYTRQAATWTVTEYRSRGIDLPFYSNATKDQSAEQMAEVFDLVSFNHYPTRDYAMVPDEHRQLVDHVRLLSAISPIPYIGELEAGIWHGYHYTKGLPYPSHYQYMLLSVLAGGAVAWTWYMLHDRDNWYMSPVNSRGKKRFEIFSLFQQFVELTKTIRPEEWVRCTSTGVTFYQPHYSIQHLALEYQGSSAVSRSLYHAGLDYSIYSLSSPKDPPALLFYDGLDWLDESAQQALLSYVESGGRLVVFQRCPRRDERGDSLNLLDIPWPDGIDSQGYMNTFYKDFVLQLGDVQVRVEVPEAVYYFRAVPGEKILAKRVNPRTLWNDNVLEEYQVLVNLGQEEDLIVGYHQILGDGSLTCLGVPPSPEIVKGVHEYLDVPIPALPRTKDVQATLYSRSETHFLIALNSGWEAKASEILLAADQFPPGRYIVRDLLRMQEKTVECHPDEPLAISVSLSPRNGAILEITPVG
jgi:hypothetical protein